MFSCTVAARLINTRAVAPAQSKKPLFQGRNRGCLFGRRDWTRTNQKRPPRGSFPLKNCSLCLWIPHAFPRVFPQGLDHSAPVLPPKKFVNHAAIYLYDNGHQALSYRSSRSRHQVAHRLRPCPLTRTTSSSCVRHCCATARRTSGTILRTPIGKTSRKPLSGDKRQRGWWRAHIDQSWIRVSFDLRTKHPPMGRCGPQQRPDMRSARHAPPLDQALSGFGLCRQWCLRCSHHREASLFPR